MYLEKYAKQWSDVLYLIFRVLIGVLFFMHGAQKLFGWFGAGPVELVSLVGLAGLVEFLGGLGIVFGFFTRLSALGGALTMLVGYLYAHAPNGGVFSPFANGGELALVYLAAMLVLFIYGAQKWCLERSVLGKEVF